MAKRMLPWLFCTIVVLAAPYGHAEDYPQRTIRLVVPNPPGGGNDIQARLIADKLSSKWGQAVIVDNRPGGAGNIGAAFVFHALPDGYTFLVTTPAPLVTNKVLYGKLSYNPDEFSPVSVLTSSPNLLVVNPQLPIHTVSELIAYAKAHPDKLSYASQGAGTGAHLTTEMMKLVTGTSITHVPYTGTAPALLDLLSGRVDMMFIAFSDGYTYVQSGQLRALAVGGEARNPLLPDVPTVSDALPGFVSVYWVGMVAPPRTPAAITDKVSAAIADILRQKDVSDALKKMNVDGVGSTPAQMTKLVDQESDRWGSVIRKIGLKVE